MNSVSSRKMVQVNTYRNWETVQRLVCHNQCIEIVSPNNFMTRRIFFVSMQLRGIYINPTLGFSTVTYICHKIIVVQHSLFMYSWQWHVAQELTQNSLLLCHCNNGQANMPERLYVHSLCFNMYRSVWKWLTWSTDGTCTNPLQATALTS
jgi:hypothetical protein